MVFDLGLQESTAELVARGKLTTKEAHFRHILFLGAYVYDHMWSLYLGRPSTIPKSYMMAVQRHIAERDWQIVPTLQAWVSLATEIGNAAEMLNNASPLTRDRFDLLTQLDAELDKQCADLPGSRLLEADQLSELPAETYGLHVQYRGVRIILHRLLVKSLEQDLDDTPSSQLKIQRSRIIMHANATRIAQLTSAYSRIFGTENFITVMLDNMFVAAALLVTHVIRHQQEDFAPSLAISENQDMYWLDCLATLFQMAQGHYPVAIRMRQALASLVEHSPLVGMFGSWTSAARRLPNDLQTQQTAPVANMRHNVHSEISLSEQDWFMQASFSNDGRLPSQEMDMTNMMSWMLSPVV